MVTDTERSYTGTNFVVLTLIVLLIMVGAYFVIATIRDVADDEALQPAAQAEMAPVADDAY